MTIEVKVPVLPESVADAVVAGWYKKTGEAVKQDETLVDLETDKVILEVPAISNGVIKEICFKEGEVVTANQVLAIIDETADVGASASVSTSASTVVQAESSKAFTQSDAPAVSPSAQKLIDEHGLEHSQVEGSGKDGRVLKEDVLKLVASSQSTEATANRTPAPTRAEPVSPSATMASVSAMPSSAGTREERRVPMTRLRARIAERLVEAQHNAAILTTFNEVNMRPIMELRNRYKEKFEKEFNVRLGFMSFFVKAVVEALKKFPDVNASIDSNEIVYHGFFDIGVAVSGSNGLVVPILRDADQMTIADIEKTILELATKARDNSLSMEDITGGTFTISNGGVFGSMLSTPILNPPQSAILGMHNIKERAMVVDGEVVVLPMMYLALSYDHRIVDGREAVQFLVNIRDSIEDPSRMLLGV